MVELRTLRLGTRAKWRAWLKSNHGRQPGVWLVFYKKHVGKTWISYDAAVEEALCFGWIDSVKKRVDEDTYVFRFTPRKPRSLWSESNRRRIAALEAASRMTRIGKAVVQAAREDGSWARKNAAEQEFAVPEELTRLLRGNRAARVGFEGLSASQRKLYLSWIGSAKRAETRQRRAEKALAKLERGERLGLV